MAFVALIVVLIIWRTHLYLRPVRIGRRAQLSMTVRDGRVHYWSRTNGR